jgi:predicted O-methyltransferase YrrM
VSPVPARRRVWEMRNPTILGARPTPSPPAASVIGTLDLPTVLGLYAEFRSDLARVRAYQSELNRRRGQSNLERRLFDAFPALRRFDKFGFFLKMSIRLIPGKRDFIYPALDDIESELLYLLVRHFQPRVVLEVSPAGGWSTSWILHGLQDNGRGTILSCDLDARAERLLPTDLRTDRWRLIVGDVRDHLHQLPSRIDLLFLDSVHDSEFAKWYLRELVPRLAPGGVLAINDIFHTSDSMFAKRGGIRNRDTEADVVRRWIAETRTPFFTAARSVAPEAYRQISSAKQALGIREPIHWSDRNTTVFCVVPKT